MELDKLRLEVTRSLDRKTQKSLGQFFTPDDIANFMVSLMSARSPEIHLLEPSAGIGSLANAFLKSFPDAYITAFEIDFGLSSHLEKLKVSLPCGMNVIQSDFLLSDSQQTYSHAMLNPPYGKLGSNSPYQAKLATLGVRCANMYAAFVVKALYLLSPGGELVALIPRSFMNGVYHSSFRRFIREHASIDHIHEFRCRRSAFKDYGVLQENVIVKLTKMVQADQITVSRSDQSLSNYEEFKVSKDDVILISEHNGQIAIPSETRSVASGFILSDLGVSVSTGPIVDYRNRHRLSVSQFGSAQYITPRHLSFERKIGLLPDRPNWIAPSVTSNSDTWPIGHYVAVKRISSKESPRRLQAFHLAPSDFSGDLVGFENHLNILHAGKSGLPAYLAADIAEYLNSEQADHLIRLVSGSTQINATDLRLLRIPSSLMRTEDTILLSA